MSHKKYLLGIDNGGTIAKAALFDLNGRELAVAARKTEMVTPRPGHTERNMDRMWGATAEAIRSVLGESGIPADLIAAIGCTGHGNGLYLVDRDGRPVRDGIISTDSRAKNYVADWYAKGVHRQVLPHTMQSLWPAQPNALLAWIRDNEPEVMRRAGWALMCKDYVRFRLTGEIFAELTDMSATSLMSVRDGNYNREVLEAFELGDLEHLLPPLRQSADVCGFVTAAAAAQTGLAEGTPVAGGLIDADGCVISSGVLDESQMAIVAGTWSVNQYISQTPIARDDIFMTCRHCVPGYFLIMEASATSASNLEWFVTQFFQAEQERLKATGGSVYDLCNDLVAATSPEEVSTVFLPFLFGSNVDPAAKACLMGINGWHNRGHVLRAIYEGIVFSHKAHVDRLLKVREMPGTIRLTGGAARSPVWVQMFADVFQLPVELPLGTELGALGAAICAGLAAGCFADYPQAVERMVQVRRAAEPNADQAALYAKKYQRYQALVAALAPVWNELS